MAKRMTPEEFADLSDDDIMSMATPPEVGGEASPPQEEEKEQPEETGSKEENEVDLEQETTVTEQEDAQTTELDTEDEDTSGEDEEEDAAGSEDTGKNPMQDETEKPKKTPEKDKKEEADKRPEENKEEKEEKEKEPDYKAMYEKIMAPFKANGKEIKLGSPEEVVQLMQMGANYTKKLQALQPKMKLLKMLDNNGLLEEGQLSYLIDLSRKDPKAIRKLVKDSGIDPLEIDNSEEPDYKPGNHRVSDEEMRFTSTLEEVSSTQEGKTVIFDINNTWDKQSKEALWSDPEILRVLTAQKKNGIYDRISSEVERRRILGTVSASVPFLSAYQTVGQELHQKGELTSLAETTSPSQDQRQTTRVVDTRTAQRRAPANNDRARAASPTRSAPPKKVADFNPLALSDEDFEKNAALAQKL